MGMYTMENTAKVSHLEKELICGRMATNMKESGYMEENMDMVCGRDQMVTVILANGRMENAQAMESCRIWKEISMKVNGNILSNMAKAKSLLKTKMFLLAITEMVNSTAMGSTFGVMEHFMKGISLMASSKVQVDG